jgi:hypothetical protein
MDIGSEGGKKWFAELSIQVDMSDIWGWADK